MGKLHQGMPQRTYTVGRAEAGQSLADWLQHRLDVAPAQARQLVRGRQVRVAGMACNDPDRRLQPGQRIDVAVTDHAPKRSGQGRSLSPAEYLDSLPIAPVLHHVDDQVVIVDKPSGLTTMRHAEDIAEQGPKARRYLPPTLADLLPFLLARQLGGKYHPVRAVHRLDNETTGLVVFARTVAGEQHLGKQLRAHTVERRYLALVRGLSQPGRIESSLVRDRGDGRRGSKAGESGGQHAVTEVQVVEELDGFTLVECRLETGRTHQVRIHLGEAGTPLCGERLYDRPLHGRPLPDGSGARRIMLHAATLGLQHPATGKRLHWTAPLPADMRELLERLRRRAKQQ
jgi:23S rRNA pseudouridine1911/1915/1917 synthase